MLAACAAVTAVGVATAAWLATSGMAIPEWAMLAVVGLALPPVAAAVLIRWVYWRTIANSVEVTPHQLPHLHAAHLGLVATIGLAHTPRLYVTNGNGRLHAAAAKCRVRRGYVVLSSDLVDLASELGDMATMRFVLAHELAHIRYGHVALWRIAIRVLPRLVWLDRSLSRAQEYTADRCAARHVPEGAAGLLVLYAGKRLHRHVDVDAYRESVADHTDGLWLRLVNLTSTHPVGFRRMEVLTAVGERGWDIHGRIL